ncbi:hypothetical protein Sango_3112000 [Sesamum angolense]|uniref:Uncharacterized protein n=1 Tax=Sesamum angolense TaxID=2727404 RepID=A0AAE1T9C3_9LAMI|nr:hypothetical protein Sango_3112000 [Sesamum angolense]
MDAWPGSSYISALPSTLDHSPLILTSVNRIEEHVVFRFDNYLTHLPGFLKSVVEIWKHRIHGTTMYETVCKLKLLKAEFRQQKKLKGNLTDNVKKAKTFLDKAQALFTTYKEDIFLDLVKSCRRVYSMAVKLEVSSRTIGTLQSKETSSSVEWDFLLEYRLMVRSMVFSKAAGDLDRVILCHLIFLFWLWKSGIYFSDSELRMQLNSRLKVNPAKSQIIFSRAVQQERQQILEYLGFQEGSLPVKYLGIPLTSSKLTLADCRPLFDKVDARLAGWNHLILSYAGRLQLIKSVLSTLHTYWASAFILPKGVLKILEKKMRKFLWHGSSGSGNAKVAWEKRKEGLVFAVSSQQN